ncbi:MAG: hypothetical protein P1V51_23875 [Deltaproteobacteria bacterium]|nr:hypothetical protein [Deltaproteobacteria bacterium]
MRSNRLAILLALLFLSGVGLALSGIYGGVEADLEDLCAAAAARELDPSLGDEEKVALAFEDFDEQSPGRGARDILAAVLAAAPEERYARLLRSAHASGDAVYQCPPLQRLLGPHPAGSAAGDWQRLCDLLVELETLPGLPTAEREQRLLRRYRMEPGSEAIAEALRLPAAARLPALRAAVEAETGRPPRACGLDAVLAGPALAP